MLRMFTHIAIVWIKRVWLPILLVGVSSTGKMNIFLSVFAPENLVSRDGFGSSVPGQPAHIHTTQAESSIIYLALTYGIPPEFRGGIHLFT